MSKVYAALGAVALGAGLLYFRDAPALTFAHEVLHPVEVAVSADVYDTARRNYISLESNTAVIPSKKDDAIVLLPYTFSATSIIAKDVDSGALLYEKNAYEEHSLASITKLMSALVLLERDIDWDSEAVVSPDNIIDNHMYAGDTYTMNDLWHAALIGSSNKAIVSMIDATGWTREQFVTRMNQRALEFGMSDTYFAGPTGLDEDNVGTASDVALLLHEALLYDKIRSTLMIPNYELYAAERNKRHRINNTNWLLLKWVPNDLQLVGGKTGYIVKSGYNFALEATNSEGKAIDVVVLGTRSNDARFSEARDVANWVFSSYSWER